MSKLVGVILCLVVGCGCAFGAPTSGKVTVAVGDVSVIPEAGGQPSKLKRGDTVAVGSVVKTGAASRAVVVITSRSAIRISANSEVVIETVDEEARPRIVVLNIKSGSLGALLKPNAAAELDFKIKTPSGIAAARGTFFSVAVEDGKGFVQVKEGRVEVTPN